jgi:hypothetical protein
MNKLNELLDLFGLDYNISIDDLKRAKKIVLMTHPDKSKLGPEYFLFYKAILVKISLYEDAIAIYFIIITIDCFIHDVAL